SPLTTGGCGCSGGSTAWDFSGAIAGASAAAGAGAVIGAAVGAGGGGKFAGEANEDDARSISSAATAMNDTGGSSAPLGKLGPREIQFTAMPIAACTARDTQNPILKVLV